MSFELSAYERDEAIHRQRMAEVEERLNFTARIGRRDSSVPAKATAPRRSYSTDARIERLLEKKPLKIGVISQRLGGNRRTVWGVLNGMVKTGRVKRTGNRHNYEYSLET